MTPVGDTSAWHAGPGVAGTSACSPCRERGLPDAEDVPGEGNPKPVSRHGPSWSIAPFPAELSVSTALPWASTPSSSPLQVSEAPKWVDAQLTLEFSTSLAVLSLAKVLA